MIHLSPYLQEVLDEFCGFSITFVFFVPVQVLDRVLDFKLHQTCTGTKKTKVLNFKVRQTTGTKKKQSKKNFTIYLARGDYPSKAFVFFVIFFRFGAL